MGLLTAVAALLLVAPDAGVAQPRVVRVLVVSDEDSVLPDEADPLVGERALLEAFAKTQGVGLELVTVGHVAELEPALLAKKGDVISAGLAVTKARQARVAFTRETGAVDEVVVGRAGAPGLPRTPEALAGKPVAVPRDSSWAEALEDLKARVPGVAVDLVGDVHSPDELAAQVADGRRALTVVDSVRLEALRKVLPQLEPLFVLTKARPVAFAVRKEDAALKAKLDALLTAHAFASKDAPGTGDLDAIQKRGVLRVLTRNNAVSFYLHRGNRHGFDYEMARAFANSLGLTLQVVLAPSYDALMPMLREGRGDVIAASFTETPQRATQVAFSRPYLFTREVLVQKKGGPVKRVEDLKGRRVTVRASSSYAEHLALLAAEHGFTVAFAPEDAEVEDLLADVGDGVVDFTVADSHFLAAEQLVRGDLEAACELSPTDQPIAFAARKENPKLLAALDAFVKRSYRGSEYNQLKTRSFNSARAVTLAKEQDSGRTGSLSAYDAVIRRYSTRYGFDWRLMSAQAWRESHFDPRAKSFAGALGLFQVMPATGKELGFTRLTDVEQGTHAGIAYMAKLMGRLEPTLPLEERTRFALAAYNAGFTRLEDARRLAKQLSLNPDAWSGQVEKALGLMARPAYARQTRAGYCRCQEPVDYVNMIENKYRAYVQLVPP